MEPVDHAFHERLCDFCNVDGRQVREAEIEQARCEGKMCPVLDDAAESLKREQIAAGHGSARPRLARDIRDGQQVRGRLERLDHGEATLQTLDELAIRASPLRRPAAAVRWNPARLDVSGDHQPFA